MTDVLERYGIPVILNAAGTLTRLSGAPVRPEVAAAMSEAAQVSVDMAELEAIASRRIADATGAEAGYVTPGAAAALLLGAAACLETGRTRVRPPDRRGPRPEFVVARSHRNSYDVAVRTAGARLVEVGLPDTVSGAGVRDVDPFEYAEAIGERTAGILFVARDGPGPRLSDVAAVARAHDVPVLVDAAARLPPAANLRRFVEEGADLVAFSGGKAIGGPAASGFLAGRADLVMSAALQHLDLDVVPDLWRPPARLVDRARLAGPPRHGIGRVAKIGKEQVVGFLVALDLFLAESEEDRHRRWLAIVDALAEGLSRVAGIRFAVEREAGAPGTVPRLVLRSPDGGREEAAALVLALEEASPSVRVDVSRVEEGALVFNPVCLAPESVSPVVRAVEAALDDGSANEVG